MHASRLGALVALASLFSLAVACGTTSDPVPNSNASPTDPNGSSGSSGSSGGDKDAGKDPPGCKFKDSTDHDGDGFSSTDGDCDDCDPKIHPDAEEIDGNKVDENCNGKVDEPPPPKECDDNLLLASADPFDAAKAMGLCKKVADGKPGWGVISAKYMKPDGTPLTDATSYGILPAFGASTPLEGKRMFAISSGAARAPTDPGYQTPSGHSKGYTHQVPAGFPKPLTKCPGVVVAETAYDGASLELKIRVPANANSMSFLTNHFTYEYSTYVCSRYTDYFIVTMSPPPAGSTDGNLVFDEEKQPIGVNSSTMLQVCNPGTHKGLTFTCPLGTSSLVGSGFDDHAATGWLLTTTPVTPGSEITLTFSIWDSGDGVLDATALIDAITFSPDSVSEVTTKPK